MMNVKNLIVLAFLSIATVLVAGNGGVRPGDGPAGGNQHMMIAGGEHSGNGLQSFGNIDARL